jgi:tRNA G18 (ribose-2'-O)-methylase SpoU
MFGEEQRGLSPEALALADEVVYIPMTGSVRSLNVGTASGIAMYDYCAKMQW